MTKYRITTNGQGDYRIESEQPKYYGWLFKQKRMIWEPVDNIGLVSKDCDGIYYFKSYVNREDAENAVKRFNGSEERIDRIKNSNLWVPVDDEIDQMIGGNNTIVHI